jgi:hypothetical protein|tara:strand:- start:301 stop:660 length:360 start_codon:yes stop_codon:yes gene_type:complete
MLRVSANNSNIEVDIQAVNGDAAAAEKGIQFGLELMKFADAVASYDSVDLDKARRSLLEVGGEMVLVDAAGVAANFQRMVRIADSMGIPIDDMQSELGKDVRGTLGLENFASAQNSIDV